MATKIFAQRYNTLQSRIQAVLGTPTNTTGYGQTVKSSQVSVGTSRVRAIDYTNLADDISRARYHQIGSSFGGIDPVIPTGVNRQKVFESYITQLESLINLIENNKDEYATSQMTVETLKNSSGANLTSSRTTVWNSSISYTFTVTFGSLNAYRAFFNTGGEIRFVTSSNYIGSELKSVNWKDLLNYVSTVRFAPTFTTAANGQLTNTTGGRDISVGQTVTLINYNSGSSVYSKHEMVVSVTRTSNTVLQFVITLTDGPENVDETVKGTITTSSSVLRANGALSKISIPAPIGANISTF